MRKLSTVFWNLIFPCKCVFCGRLLPPGTERERAVCAVCERELPFSIAHDRCLTCGRPIDSGESHCERCGKTGHPYVRLCAPYLYKNAVKRSLLRFKRESARGYAKVYARHMAALLAYDCSGKRFDAVVSAPPRKKRMRQEGYDQAACLARALAKELGIPYLRGALTQREKRKKQSELSAAERWRNVSGNIRVTNPNAVADRVLLLVDDICTTGATLHACGWALRDAGAKRVYAATAAASDS